MAKNTTADFCKTGVTAVVVSWCLGVSVSWFLGLPVSWFAGVEVLWFLGFVGSWVRGFLVSGFLCFLVSWCLGFLVARFFVCGSEVSWFYGFSVSWFSVSWILGFLVCWPGLRPQQGVRWQGRVPISIFCLVLVEHQRPTFSSGRDPALRRSRPYLHLSGASHHP